MHITLETDYAVRIVYCLAKEQKRMDAKTIAEKTGVTLRFSLKILRKLVANELVKSYKGTQGGYEIGRPLKEISLNDVIETVEGPFYISRCLDEGYECGQHEVKTPCKFKKIYQEISDAVVERLKKVTFDQIVE